MGSHRLTAPRNSPLAHQEGCRAPRWVKLLLALYAGGMLYLLFFQRTPYGGPLSFKEYVKLYSSWKPGDTLWRMLWAWEHGTPYQMDFALRNLVGNVLLFIPLGVFLPAIWRKQRRWWTCLLTVIVLITCVELTQLFTTLGSADVDDVILNSLGAMLGYLGWWAATYKKE